MSSSDYDPADHTNDIKPTPAQYEWALNEQTRITLIEVSPARISWLVERIERPTSNVQLPLAFVLTIAEMRGTPVDPEKHPNVVLINGQFIDLPNVMPYQDIMEDAHDAGVYETLGSSWIHEPYAEVSGELNAPVVGHVRPHDDIMEDADSGCTGANDGTCPKHPNMNNLSN